MNGNQDDDDDADDGILYKKIFRSKSKINNYINQDQKQHSETNKKIKKD